MQSLWNIKVVVLVKPEHENRISHVSTSSVKTGIANTLGRGTAGHRGTQGVCTALGGVLGYLCYGGFCCCMCCMRRSLSMCTLHESWYVGISWEGSQGVCCTWRGLVDAQGRVPEHGCFQRRALCAVHREGSGNVCVA